MLCYCLGLYYETLYSRSLLYESQATVDTLRHTITNLRHQNGVHNNNNMSQSQSPMLLRTPSKDSPCILSTSIVDMHDDQHTSDKPTILDEARANVDRMKAVIHRDLDTISEQHKVRTVRMGGKRRKVQQTTPPNKGVCVCVCIIIAIMYLQLHYLLIQWQRRIMRLSQLVCDYINNDRYLI
jgi:hypothetical protein